jgi:hypothetical protein
LKRLAAGLILAVGCRTKFRSFKGKAGELEYSKSAERRITYLFDNKKFEKKLTEKSFLKLFEPKIDLNQSNYSASNAYHNYGACVLCDVKQSPS